MPTVSTVTAAARRLSRDYHADIRRELGRLRARVDVNAAIDREARDELAARVAELEVAVARLRALEAAFASLYPEFSLEQPPGADEVLDPPAPAPAALAGVPRLKALRLDPADERPRLELLPGGPE